MLANQPDGLPTNKMLASLVGAIIGSIFYTVVLLYFWPFLADVYLFGTIGVLHGCQVIGGGIVAWFTRDRVNVPV